MTYNGPGVVALRIRWRILWVQVTTRAGRPTGITPGEVTSPDTTQELVARVEST